VLSVAVATITIPITTNASNVMVQRYSNTTTNNINTNTTNPSTLLLIKGTIYIYDSNYSSRLRRPIRVLNLCLY
jgi:hypothetical protein